MTTSQVDIPLDNGRMLRVEPLRGGMFRIRLGADTAFREGALVKYGVVLQECPAAPYDMQREEGAVVLRTDEAMLRADIASGRIELYDRRGRLLLKETTGKPAASGFFAEFALEDDERLYGLGDESRHGIEKRGHRAKIWVKNVDCYAPSPFLFSSRGWGVFLNTTWRHFFDLGSRHHDRWQMFAKRGELDYVVFAGANGAELIERFTRIAGRPELLPMWAYGLTFVCNQQATAREVLDDAMQFRREGIPCDLIGLEPGWMSTFYDYSVDKKWHPERFYIPPWAPKGPQTFIGGLERLGFKLSLWLCSDYDITYHEERQAGLSPLPNDDDTSEGSYNADDFEQDLRAHAPVYMDQLTKRDESWFEHLKAFVDQGASAFKMDGARQVNEHPDRRWGNGMDDEEMHNAYPVLLNKQMYEGFREHTGLRPMVYSSGGYVGIQRYAATWAGDTGGGPKPLISLLNHALSGHANTSCDMDVFTPEGIHFGFLQPWSQVNSWAYWRHPWLLGDRLLPIFKAYAKLRYRLLPYLYAAANTAYRTGLPIMRPMPLAYPDDPASDGLLQQYMLGDSLLVAAFTREVHLPTGEWIDYWSGRRYVGPLDLTVDVPADRGGPLFIRAGAIIPHWPEMQYVGQKPLDTLSLYVYPNGRSDFTLYEDDGVSMGYRDGETALTRMVCYREASQEAGAGVDWTVLEIGKREGRYAGMPEERRYELHIYEERVPKEVRLNGRLLQAEEEWRYEYEQGAILLLTENEHEDGSAQTIRYR